MRVRTKILFSACIAISALTLAGATAAQTEFRKKREIGFETKIHPLSPEETRDYYKQQQEANEKVLERQKEIDDNLADISGMLRNYFSDKKEEERMNRSITPAGEPVTLKDEIALIREHIAALKNITERQMQLTEASVRLLQEQLRLNKAMFSLGGSTDAGVPQAIIEPRPLPPASPERGLVTVRDAEEAERDRRETPRQAPPQKQNDDKRESSTWTVQ